MQKFIFTLADNYTYGTLILAAVYTEESTEHYKRRIEGSFN